MAKAEFFGRLNTYFRGVYYKSVDYNLYFLSSLMLYCQSKRLNKSKGKRILFVGSRASIDDLDAIIKYSGKLEYFILERFLFKRIISKYLNLSGLSEVGYYEKTYEEQRAEVFSHIDKVMAGLIRLLHIDAVMTSNIGYVEQQELLRVVKSRGVKVIVLLKEGLAAVKKPEVLDLYKGKRAVCDLLLCYNEAIKNGLRERSIQGLDPSIIKVTGIPRLDFYVRKKTKYLRQLVFFVYDMDVLGNKITNDDFVLNEIKKISSRFYFDLFRLVSERTDIKFIFKTKPTISRSNTVKDMASDYFGRDNLPNNIHITSNGYAKDLVLESSWIIGISNSTTVLEGMLLNKKVACPNFSKVTHSNHWDFFSGNEDMISYINSYNDLIEFLDVTPNNKISNETGKDNLLQAFFYRTDGYCSQRVEDYINSLW